MSVHDKTYRVNTAYPAYEMPYTAPSPAAYYTPMKNKIGYSPRAALVMTGVGAVVGGASAAARSIRRVQKNEIDGKEAAADIAKEMAGSGITTGLAAAAISAANIGLVASLLGTVVLATGTRYLWDGIVNRDAN